jgi:hypothetical protein
MQAALLTLEPVLLTVEPELSVEPVLEARSLSPSGASGSARRPGATLSIAG